MEIFKDVKGYEGRYQVSNLGRVKSLGRYVKRDNNGCLRYVKESILKLGINKQGYLRINLSIDGRYKTHKVHQLVAMAFLNHTPAGMKLICDHIDNNKLNNNVNNLQLITQRKNTSKDKKGTSRFTGVCWDKHANKWKSSIQINGKIKHIGCFKSELKASKAYQTVLKTLQNEKEEENQRIETVY